MFSISSSEEQLSIYVYRLLTLVQQQQSLFKYCEHGSPCSAHEILFIFASLCSLTDVPQPTDGGVSVVALNEAGKVRVTWTRPTLGPGQVITGCSVQYRRRGTTPYTTHSVFDSSTTSYTITSLRLGTVYRVRVASVGPLGLSGYCCGSGKQVTTYNSECTIFTLNTDQFRYCREATLHRCVNRSGWRAAAVHVHICFLH